MAEVVYTARAETAGGRESGVSRSSDGVLDIRLSLPGSGRIGTNPEQLLAAGWSASFESAVVVAARGRGVALPLDTRVAAEVDLCQADGAWFLQVRLALSLPGVAPDIARILADEARRTCPFCRATRGNVDVAIGLA